MTGEFGTFISNRIFFFSKYRGREKKKKKNNDVRGNGFPDNAALVTEGPHKGTAEQGRVHTC
jgi:hypothetical protein